MANKDFLEFKLSGLDELAYRLRKLPERVAKKHLQNATNKGADIAVRAAKQNAPVYDGKSRPDVTPGLLKKSIKRRVIRSGRFTTAITGIGIPSDESKRGYKAKTGGKRSRKGALDTGFAGFANSDAYYWRFLELGYNHKTPSGKRTYIAPKPFLTPAFESNIDSMTRKVGSMLDIAIIKETRGLNKK